MNCMQFSETDQQVKLEFKDVSYFSAGGNVQAEIAEHNSAVDAHNDIRLLIDGLASRLNALADSDDTTLDQMSEIVTYIKANKALIDAITVPTKVSQLTNDTGYLTSYTETDPTVPAWAKTPEKPEYTAQEVGARPDSWTPSAADVGADSVGTAVDMVALHNVALEAHNDIRLLIEGLANRLNALADSDDTTLDQMSEIVAYIKANKTLIDSITTSKLDVTAIADWAKAATKPSYTKSEVGLGNVDNVKQYSASNPPPYPVTSVNGKTGAVTVAMPEIVQATGSSTSAVMSQKAVTDALVSKNQLSPEFAESVDWLKENGDQSKMYVLPDGFIYAYQTGEAQEVFTDVLKDVGYTKDQRINSSGLFVAENAKGSDVTGYIPCKTGDVIRIKDMVIPDAYADGAYWSILAAYDSSKTYIKQINLILDYAGYGDQVDAVSENGNIVQFTVKESFFGSNVAYIAISAKEIKSTAEVYVNSTMVEGSAWVNTGLAFVPADYEDRIIALENELADLGGTVIPDYWASELKTKADAIQQAMESAGRNKSAFLWYTDAHWQTNSKVSPLLLKFLLKNTPMNKVNFGGDIINDPAAFTHDNIKYAYEWRAQIADLPNHHSVAGNHDLNHNSTDVRKTAYAFLIASEESPDMVMGGELYYYIDNPAEKTRYLYLDYMTSDHTEMTDQGQFIVDAIKSVSDGWHIVVIAHRWFQYTSASEPTVGSIPSYEEEILQVFDAYNARTTYSASNYFATQNFADSKGKVEFCIGGHIHADYDFETAGGIPVIITAADTNQERSPDDTEDSGTIGTTTESAVFGIIADYTANKITVVGIGRGTSRIVEGA